MLRPLAVLAPWLALLGFAAPALGGTVQGGPGGSVVYGGGPGADVISVSLAADAVTFTTGVNHDGGLLTAAPCTTVSSTQARCPLPPALTIATGDGADQVTITSPAGVRVPTTLDGGGGGDVLLGAGEPDSVHGGPGDDVLGLAGADDLHGDDGNDTVRVLGYAAGAAVRVSLDDVADDGRRGDGANVHSDVENVLGGPADETVVGTPAHNVISTGGGSDDVDAGGGFDDISTGAGADHVDARDGVADRVDCADAFDSVVVDTLDFLSECEQVDVSSALEPDSDHDGYPRQVDCDDHNTAIAPGLPDPPGDGIDQDCDGHDSVIVDADHDGYAAPLDCDDRDPLVHPGATEIYGNARDEDCNGRNDPYQALNPRLRVGFRSLGPEKRFTRVTAFAVAGVPAGTSARLTCRGEGCPFRALSRTATAKGLDLGPRLAAARLRGGAILQLTLRRADALTATFAYTLRRGIATTRHACTRPDTGRAIRCDTA
jgi:Ca2+-binding RTX toxin-like protein